jgi:hypothetical protein
MAEITQLHKPEWQFVEPDWVMVVGNRDVARLVPLSMEERSPILWANWLSEIHPDFDDHGWSNVEFETVRIGQLVLEQWWSHMCRGEKYRPDPGEEPTLAHHSRWTGEPLGEAAGQDAGIGQSH